MPTILGRVMGRLNRRLAALAPVRYHKFKGSPLMIRVLRVPSPNVE